MKNHRGPSPLLRSGDIIIRRPMGQLNDAGPFQALAKVMRARRTRPTPTWKVRSSTRRNANYHGPQVGGPQERSLTI